MNARRPKSWGELSRTERQKICDYLLVVLNEQEEKDMRVITELFIKMICCVLHDIEGYGEKRLTLLIGNLQPLFRAQCKLVEKNKQIEYLDRRMAEIFKKDGFPQMFIDNLLGEKDEKALRGITAEDLIDG